MKRKRKGRDDKSAIDILEEATHLLRAHPFFLASYYFGSLPFILGLLYFWTDMSTGANAWQHCAHAAWGLALLFIWMKTWQSVYVRRLLAGMRGEDPPHWGIRRILRTAAIQTAIQPWSILVLPIALVIMLPFPQAFAFFQNATLVGSGDEGEIRSVLQRSWRHASLWPKQNITLIWLTSPFLLALAAFFIFVLVPVSSSFNPEAPIPALLIVSALVVIPFCPLGMITALNIAAVLILLPWLLKIFFDVDTIFSMSGIHLMNNTFFAVVCGLSYLCLDPLMKASYCLRCFYGESVQTGEDLRVELCSASRPGGILAISLIILLSLGLFGNALAEPSTGDVPALESPVPTQQLDSAIESVLQYPEYTWRMPREKPPEPAGGQGALYEFLDSIVNTVRDGWNYVKKGLMKVWNFIKEILSRIYPSLPKLEKPRADWTTLSRALIIIPLGCIVVVLAFLGWRAWKSRKPRTVSAGVPAQPLPDIASQDLDATALPEDGWLSLARQLMGEGELRLALRALYLATLANLAHQELITIAKYKSDREYEMELRRRSHTRPQLAAIFAENRGVFERAWYGLHEVTPGIIERFSQNQGSIRVYAQR